MAKEMGLEIPPPLTFDEFMSGQFYDGNTRKFAIDNADTLFQHILGVPITAISINKDNPKWTGGECVEKTR